MWEEIICINLSLLIITSETLRPVNQHPNVPKGDTDGLTGHDAIDVWELLVIEQSQVVSIWAFLACYTLLWKDMKWQFKQTYQVLGGSKRPFTIESWSFMIIYVDQMFLYLACISPRNMRSNQLKPFSFYHHTKKKQMKFKHQNHNQQKSDRNHYLPQITWNPAVVFPYKKTQSLFFLLSSNPKITHLGTSTFKFRGSSCDSSIVTNCVGLYPPEWRNPPIPHPRKKSSRKTGRPEIEIEERKKGV